ncbi:MgtC/SapB family protein [Paracoccus tibetensis]|uniref:Protein MgtC n=1 Tax=Paracoccus tibetensis TaxID=336292 RepID=A0A1G5H4A4_9RHOB|nr:MgtC/SapB family protein [Paracoccus tibetensis]SCY57768.1 putative Mg2+ transporter-C (MgtC) family protein [Paracoccus tibetensis]
MPPVLLDLFQPLDSMSLGTASARLGLALVLGGVIGWERERAAHAAGLRTHMLIAMAAALFTIIAMELTHLRLDRDAAMQVDPLRLIEAVTAGVAFLAAGSIIFSGGSVRGITTGASMWLAGAVGLTAGNGKGTLAVIAALLALLVLWLARLVGETSAGGAGGGTSPGKAGGAGGAQPPAASRDAAGAGRRQ